MTKYKSVKTVMAEPMWYHEAGDAGLIRDYNESAEDKAGFKVVYEDGYESWSPEKSFMKGYIGYTPRTITSELGKLQYLYDELDTLKWVIGADEGWELGVAAVRSEIGKLLELKEKDK